MTVLQPGLGPRDSQILELLRGGAPIQRIVDIGRHRRSWNPIHVGNVVAFHLDDRPPLKLVEKPEPTGAQCGTPSGYRRHRRLDEKPCDDCNEANNAAGRLYAARKAGKEWHPAKFRGTPSSAILGVAQIAVLEQLCLGVTANRSIGDELGITEDTVKSHMRDILAALGATDRAHAVVRVMSGQVRVKVRQGRKEAAS